MSLALIPVTCRPICGLYMVMVLFVSTLICLYGCTVCITRSGRLRSLFRLKPTAAGPDQTCVTHALGESLSPSYRLSFCIRADVVDWWSSIACCFSWALERTLRSKALVFGRYATPQEGVLFFARGICVVCYLCRVPKLSTATPCFSFNVSHGEDSGWNSRGASSPETDLQCPRVGAESALSALFPSGLAP